MYDILIIGGGAAATSAALTALNRGKTVAVVANPADTTALYRAECVTNYPGAEKASGAELADRFRTQLEKSGAELISGRALQVMRLGSTFGVAVESNFYEARAVILATGITRETLYPGESEYLGRGVSYCATCDGMLYRGRSVAVVGNSAEAARDADFLRSIGCNVTEFRESGRYAIEGGERTERLVYNGASCSVDGIFIIKDTVSVAKLAAGVEYKNGGIVTDRHMETAVSGIFAAGDCTGKPYQIAKAVGEGNVAALSACEYIDKKGE